MIVHLRDEPVTAAVLPETVLHYVAAHTGERDSRRRREPRTRFPPIHISVSAKLVQFSACRSRTRPS